MVFKYLIFLLIGRFIINLFDKIYNLQLLSSTYTKTNDLKERKIIKKKAVKLYFAVEEELAKIKYDLRLIDIRNFKPHEKAQLNLIPDLFYDFENIPSQSKLPHAKKNSLTIPLLLFLFFNHNKNMSALTASAIFMDSVKSYLREGDFQHLKSGSIRFITNTRFASDNLRSTGLLRTSQKEIYKYWQLTLLGILLAAMIFEDDDFNFPSGYLSSSDSLFFRQTLYKYINKLIYEDGFNKLVKQLFKDKVANEIYSIKHNFVMILAELLHIIKNTCNKNDIQEFFNKYNSFLEEIDDKVFGYDFANAFLLNIPSVTKYNQLMKAAFTNL